MESTILNEKGQSTIEYVLLLVVIASLAVTVFNSQAFKNIFGPESSFFTIMQNRVQFTYRHGLEGESDSDNFNYGDGTSHFSYFSQEENGSRFFLPLEGYGAE